MANKVIVESIKLAFATGAAFLGTRAIAKLNPIQNYMADKFPGVASAGIASGIFAGSVKMGKSLKDNSIRTGLQAGVGAAAIVQIANIGYIKRNLPPSVQNLLAGDPNPNLRILSPEQLSAAITAEAQRHANSELAKMGFVQSDSKQIPVQTDSIVEEPNTIEGDEIYFGSSDEIYF